MINSQIIAETRERLHSNATKFTDQYLLDGINLHHQEVVMEILRVLPDFSFMDNEVVRDIKKADGLLEGQIGWNGTYPLPCNLIKLTRADVKQGSLWQTCKLYDVADGDGELGDEVPTDCEPRVRVEKNCITIRPLPTEDVTEGLHIWFVTRPAPLLLTERPLFEGTFHELLVMMGALRGMEKWFAEYTETQRDSLRAQIAKKKMDISAYYKSLHKRVMVMTPRYEIMA